MADLFLDSVVGKIIDVGFDYLKDQIRWQTGMQDEQQKMRHLHTQIKAVVFAASQQEIGDQNSALKEWLWQLRDAIDGADDVLDEFEYLKYKEQLARDTEKTKEFHCASFLIEGARKFFERARKFIQRARKNDPTLKRLEEAVHEFMNVSAKVSDFLSLLKIDNQVQQKQQQELNDRRETGAMPTDDFIGRCEEMESIMQWLSNTHITSSHRYKNISLLSIVGHGGMGKTTLSRHAYDNVMTNEFDVKMWVCVSTNFEVKRVIAGMLESHKKSKCDLDNLDALQGSLKSEVMDNKFLLVLDDIWEDDEKDKIKWEKIFAPLASGSLGSKILVTTRMNSCALMIANVLRSKDHTILSLGGMKKDDCLQLLNNIAFGTVENPDAHKKSFLKKIVKKVLGSPLAAKVIGGVLSSDMDERHWTTILNSDIKSMEGSQNIIFPILKLSYIFLPKPLQMCFSFCSIFPQDHKFDKDDLIRMWIALNFIQPCPNSIETMEEIGERYFNILVKKCFFEKFGDESFTYYKIHDLLHELAQFVSARECCRVMWGEELPNCETIRHLSIGIDNPEVLRKIKNFKKLRSLFLECYTDNQKDFSDVLSEIFNKSSSIRLLIINTDCQMPEAIGDLIHLRYLKCDNVSEVTQMPRSICNLYHMYFIVYDSHGWTFPDDFLPKDLNNLFNLRYVQLPWDRLSKMHFIGKLHLLQKLNNFFVKNEAGYRIYKLEHRNELCQLKIYQLENVKDVEEACSAKLCDKGSLKKLYLHWGNPYSESSDSDSDSSDFYKEVFYKEVNNGQRNIVDCNLVEEVFDNLQPNNNLKLLKINAYMGTRSAIWMNDANFISKSNLEHINLKGCLEWQILPPFGQLRSLKSLYLCTMPKVKSIDYIPSLEVLHIVDLNALEDWFDAAAAANDSLFPCLTELHLERCPNLRVLPSLPPKIQVLRMDDISWKCFSWRQCHSILPNVEIEDIEYFRYLNGQLKACKVRTCDPSDLLIEPLRSITSDIDLTICNNDKLVSFPTETEKWFLQVSSSLCKLRCKNLESLQSLPSFLKSLSSLEELDLHELKSLECLSSLSNISSLKRISLKEVPLLKSLSDLPTSLEVLSIENLESWECQPSSLSTFSSLKELNLSNFPLLKSLPILLPSLKKLYIRNLDSLECLPPSLSACSSLKNLNLISIPLKALPDLPPSLIILNISFLESLECLPPSLSTMFSLEQFRINCVPLPKHLPDLPSSLKYLQIMACHEELKKRYDKISGFDRDKVAHIPDVRIY